MTPDIQQQSPDMPPVLAPDEPKERQVLVGMDRDAIVAFVVRAGFPAFRGRQLYEWIYRHCALSFDEMTSLSRDFRAWLHEHCVLGHPELGEIRGGADDGSRKILFRLADGKVVESVLMKDRDWQTLCVSSQVGCAVDCKFCMTGFGGFQRQMTRGEIVSQFILAKKLVNQGLSPRNMVFMGMGEPLLNVGEVIPAIRLLTDEEGLAVSSRRITVSTSGILPGIEALGSSGTGVNLAISLNASNNAERSEIMPINKRYPIEALLHACREFPLRNRRRITFEYVLLADQNDSLENARELSRILKDIPCKINLIPWNPDPHLPYRRPEAKRIHDFQEYLLEKNFTVSVRYSKGLDIGAACGQLAAHWKSRTNQPGVN